MAYLPTVNESKEPLVVGDELVKSLKKRLDFSVFGVKVVSPLKKLSLPDKLTTKQDNSISVLNKLYEFITKDTYKQIRYEEELEKESDDESTENEFIQTALIEQTGDLKPKSADEKKEQSLFGKLLDYTKYFTYGRFVYKNWDSISKLLGLEKLTNTIRGLSEEFGINKIINDMELAINDMMDKFGLETLKFDVTETPKAGVIGPKSINAADPKRVMQAMNFFIGKGLSPEQSAGLVGNMLQENPAFATDIGGDHGKAGGLFQWQGARQVGMGTTFESQLQHAWDEMTGKAPTRDIGSERALEDLRTTTTPEQAAVAVQGTKRGRGLTRAGTPMIENRMRYAAGALELYRTGKVPDTTANQSITPQPKFDTNSNQSGKTDLESNIGGNTIPKIDLRSPRIETDRHIRIDKGKLEKGEMGVDEKTRSEDLSISKVEDTGRWATEQELSGLVFDDHSPANPIGFEKQITKLQAKKMQQLRSELGMSSMHINSGKRSKDYNKKKGGANNSAHLYGMACDVSTRGMDDAQRVAFVRAATKVGFGGIGIYPTFIHVDTSKVRIWKETRVSREMQSALDDHVKGRIGQFVDINVPVPDKQESGEVGIKQGGDKPSEKSSSKETEKKNFLDWALDEYQSKLSLFTNLLNENSSKESIVRMENLLDQLSTGQIPRKDRYLPDLGLMFSQNNYLINNLSNNQQVSQRINNPDLDIPASQANPYMSNYFKE